MWSCRDPEDSLNELTLVVGSKSKAQRWVIIFKLFIEYFEASPCAEFADWEDSAEFGICILLKDLKDIGIHLPDPPKREELERLWYNESSGQQEASPIYYLMQSIFESINYRCVWHDRFIGYYSNSVEKLTDIDPESSDHTSNIYWSLWQYTFKDFKEQLIEAGADEKKLSMKIDDGEKWIRSGLMELCEGLAVNSLPFETEYFNLITEDAFWLMEEAELIYAISRKSGSLYYQDYYTQMTINLLQTNNELLGNLQNELYETLIPKIAEIAADVAETKRLVTSNARRK